jgi:hypothetical protein
MNVHQVIYETLDKTDEEVFGILGGGSIDPIIDRREKVRMFLKDHEWDLEAYKVWMRSGVTLPPKRTMVRSFGEAVGDVMKHGISIVDDEEYKKRLAICDDCEYFLPKHERCSKCGCFMKGKAKVEAWHCPIDKW